MDQPFPGQRWVSNSEPELGIGVVGKAEFGRVQMFFPAAQQSRTYALHAAPLRRVRYEAGDTIRTHDGRSFAVSTVEERAHILYYQGDDGEISEAELADTITFSKPEDRLKAGQVDDLHAFDLRVEALRHRAEMRQSPVRGFAGGRVDLLPHQMYIASEVAGRLFPRVLLADEVGLGKTIEACLILHRLHITGRAERVLILVPEALVNQWFVELFRRFHLTFSIFDEERCESIESNAENGNPFLESQLIIASTAFLAGAPQRAQQALEAGFDLLIVDEAHHLAWSPDAPSAEYQLVDQLAAKVPGVLLLTATPQQLGPEGHFARLRLLDPGRYADLPRFLEEATHYEEVARAIDRLLAGKKLTAADKKLFATKSSLVRELLDALNDGADDARDKLIAALLDEFGTGRVMFRNTRAALAGFPSRQAHLVPIDPAGGDPIDAKVKWLAGLLRQLGQEKVLLICSTRQLAADIHEKLLREINLHTALFHEGLSILQRDRHAAFFADEDGARILLCSEIGSEGRNFQFAHHLVLFDLPLDPELLEQRIGRLDRIGQTSTIHIHVPHLQHSSEEVLARWYHHGLDAFQTNLHGATEIARGLRPELDPLLQSWDETALDTFLQHTRELRAQVVQKLERGHDRLLELGSCRTGPAATVIDAIRALDDSTAFQDFFLRLADHFGLHLDDNGPRTWVFRPGELKTDRFPALPEDGLTATFDRTRALSRENIAFLTSDHPLPRGAIDLLLGSEDGNSTFAICRHPKSECLFLETHFVVECAAPAALHLDRFLAPLPMRLVVDHTQADRRENDPIPGLQLEKSKPTSLFEKTALRNKLFPAMLAKARKLAETDLTDLITAARERAAEQIGGEIARLEALRQVNDHIRPEEISALRAHLAQILQALGTATLRLDCLRLIFQMKAK